MLSESPTVQKVTSGRKNEKEEQTRNGKVCKAAKRKESGTEKFNERRRGMQKKNKSSWNYRSGQLYCICTSYVIGWAGHRRHRSHRTSAGRRRL